MLSYLGHMWKQMYYGFLSDLHQTIDFENYFVILGILKIFILLKIFRRYCF